MVDYIPTYITNKLKAQLIGYDFVYVKSNLLSLRVVVIVFFFHLFTLTRSKFQCGILRFFISIYFFAANTESGVNFMTSLFS